MGKEEEGGRRGEGAGGKCTTQKRPWDFKRNRRRESEGKTTQSSNTGTSSGTKDLSSAQYGLENHSWATGNAFLPSQLLFFLSAALSIHFIPTTMALVSILSHTGYV